MADKQPRSGGVLDPATLAGYGVVPRVGVGVQLDITAVVRKVGDNLVDGYMCDHNCTITYRGRPTGGHYNCPAAFSLNRGAVAATMAPARELCRGVDQVVAAGREEQRRFVDEEFDDYAKEFRLPVEVSEQLRRALLADSSEVALFGGSPEAHPEVLDLVAGLREAGHEVHITVTGRRFMRDPDLLRRLADSGVDVLALSLDDVASPEELRTLLSLETAELYRRWRDVPPSHGQRQKVYEAVYTARSLQQQPAPRPRLLLNMAIHQGNLTSMGDVLSLLTDELSPVALNPFPMQSAFEDRAASLPGGYVAELARFVTAVIEDQHRQADGVPTRWSLVQRMHYWLALAAALAGSAAGERVSGWGTWKCFSSGGSGRYVQIAGNGQGAARSGYAGGRAGCFWNETLAAPELPAIWDARVDQLAGYLRDRPTRAAAAAHPCAGCLFPRLVADMVSLETGLDASLRDPYLALRTKHLGF